MNLISFLKDINNSGPWEEPFNSQRGLFVQDLKIFLIYQNADGQNTFYLVGRKASEKVRDEVVKLWNIVERMLVVKWK